MLLTGLNICTTTKVYSKPTGRRKKT